MQIEKYTAVAPMLVAVDCIIFGFDGEALKVLLIKRDFQPKKGKWSLMGGFVEKKESVRTAASRVLQELTGMQDIYLEQIGCFGDVKRDPGGRVISVAYFSLIKIDEYNRTANDGFQYEWFPTNALPELIFDHADMVALAKERLMEKASTHPIGFNLMPARFTLQQLQALYEGIFSRRLDKRNFTRKIMGLGILKKLTEKEKTRSRKGAFYYVFDKKKYNRLFDGSFRF